MDASTSSNDVQQGEAHFFEGLGLLDTHVLSRVFEISNVKTVFCVLLQLYLKK